MIVNYLVIGYLNDISIAYLSVYAKNNKLKFVCIDDKEQNSYINLSYTNAEYIKDEINKQTIEKLIKERNIEKVINFYELKEEGYSLEEYNAINYDFVVDLYNICTKYGVKHFTHMSTALVYKSSYSNFCTEQRDLSITSHYVASKINAELFLLKQNNTLIFRASESFGVLCNDNLLNNLIKDIIEDKEVIIHEDSDFIRNYTHAKDLSFYVNKMSQHNMCGLYNLSSEYFLTAKQLIKIVVKELNYKKEIKYSSSKKVIVDSIKLDNQKLSKKLSYDLSKQSDKLKYTLREYTKL